MVATLRSSAGSPSTVDSSAGKGERAGRALLGFGNEPAHPPHSRRLAHDTLESNTAPQSEPNAHHSRSIAPLPDEIVVERVVDRVDEQR